MWLAWRLAVTSFSVSFFFRSSFPRTQPRGYLPPQPRSSTRLWSQSFRSRSFSSTSTSASAERPSTCFSMPSVWLHLSRQHEQSLKTRIALAMGLLSLAFIVACPGTAAAAAPDPSAYRQAVEGRYNLVTVGAHDQSTARQTVSILEAGTGTTQPEIIASLERNPPDFVEAGDRLHALLDAIDHPATTAD